MDLLKSLARGTKFEATLETLSAMELSHEAQLLIISEQVKNIQKVPEMRTEHKYADLIKSIRKMREGLASMRNSYLGIAGMMLAPHQDVALRVLNGKLDAINHQDASLEKQERNVQNLINAKVVERSPANTDGQPGSG